MRDKDDRLMEEALEQMQEGIFDRMRASKGTIGKGLGSKAVSGIGKGISKLAGQGDSRMAQAARQAGQAAQDIGSAGQMDVQEQKAQQLMEIYKQKIDKLYAEIQADAGKLGIDLKAMAQQDFSAGGTGGAYPKLAGLSAFLRSINDAKRNLGGGAE